MYCSKCGNIVNGNFCGKCGKQVTIQSNNINNGFINTTNDDNLIIERPEFFMGFAVNITISIDNNKEIKLGNGQKYSFKLQPGEHSISYDSLWRRKKSITLNIIQGKNYYLKFEYDPIWGGFKLSDNSILL